MRLPRKSEKKKQAETLSEDTQEMFTADFAKTDDPDETREYDLSAVPADGEPPVEDPAPDDMEPDNEDEDFEDEESEPDEFAEGEVEDEEFEDWDEDPVDDTPGDERSDETEAAGADPNAAERSFDQLSVWFAGFRRRTSEVAGRGRDYFDSWLRKAGQAKLPRHEIDGLKVLAVAGAVAVALLVGAGGYLIGKGTGADLDTARLEGQFAGRQAGAIEGATRGYAAGFRQGREIAFRNAYAASYRRNYQRAYEDAGMDPPKMQNIEVPRP